MIEHLFGTISRKSPTEVVIDCGGVGYVLGISLHTYSKLPDQGTVRVLVHTHFSENGQRLYGFHDDLERRLFRMLQGVRGIGPGIAVALLSHDAPERVIERLASSDIKGLTQVRGVGRKTAERLVLELKDRLGELPLLGRTSSPRSEAESVLIPALRNLGLSESEAGERARSALEALPSGASIELLLRRALRFDAARREQST